MFVLAKTGARAYTACRGLVEIVCIKLASRNEECVSSCLRTIVEWSKSALSEKQKATNLQKASGLLNSFAEEFVTPNGPSAPNGFVKLNILFT